MEHVTVATIGFTKSKAEHFFERILNKKVNKIIDVRLNNTSQLSGFAKADDLAFFLKRIGNIKYEHYPVLAPSGDILKSYKKEKGDWKTYEEQFLQLMEKRRIETILRPEMLEGACLLCSESTPHHCHRRLVVDYLNGKWGNVLNVTHL